MYEETQDLINSLKMKIEALQIRNEALRIRIETLEMRHQVLALDREGYKSGTRSNYNMPSMPQQYTAQPQQYSTQMQQPEVQQQHAPQYAPMQDTFTPEREEDSTENAVDTKKATRKKVASSELKKMQAPLDKKLHAILVNESFNKATYRAIVGILLCLYENDAATVSLLNEYIGGSRVTIVRHTGLLKKMNLLEYVGSRKKGHYELTEEGKELLNSVRAQIS